MSFLQEELIVRSSYDRALWRRCMTGWWQCVVPPAPSLQHAHFWASVWFGLGFLTIALYGTGIQPSSVFAGLIGAAFLIGVLGYPQRTRMNRFWDVVGQNWDRAGETQASYKSGGLILEEEVSRKELSWDAIDAIAGQSDVTALRSRIAMIAFPEAALPDGLDAKSFRELLRQWRAR